MIELNNILKNEFKPKFWDYKGKYLCIFIASITYLIKLLKSINLKHKQTNLK